MELQDSDYCSKINNLIQNADGLRPLLDKVGSLQKENQQIRIQLEQTQKATLQLYQLQQEYEAVKQSNNQKIEDIEKLKERNASYLKKITQLQSQVESFQKQNMQLKEQLQECFKNGHQQEQEKKISQQVYNKSSKEGQWTNQIQYYLCEGESWNNQSNWEIEKHRFGVIPTGKESFKLKIPIVVCSYKYIFHPGQMYRFRLVTRMGNLFMYGFATSQNLQQQPPYYFGNYYFAVNILEKKSFKLDLTQLQVQKTLSVVVYLDSQAGHIWMIINGQSVELVQTDKNLAQKEYKLWIGLRDHDSQCQFEWIN